MIRRLLVALGLAAIAAAQTSPAQAQTLISRTITVDANTSEWRTAPSILTNSGQYSTDCSMGQACETDPVQSTGRDLKYFAYTWDANNLYFYVERYASSSNTTTWLFYLDEDVDGKMESGERFFVVDWKGSNQSTNAVLCTYVAATAGGDNFGGDGTTLPGSNLGICDAIYYGIDGGTSNGLEMETRLPWSALGFSGPQNIAFHISSSRGLNLPTQVEDNMGGPGGGSTGGGGGQLFPPDMSVGMTVTDNQVSGFELVTLNVTLTNVYFDNYTNVALTVGLPTEVQYVSHTAPSGTSFIDTNADNVPDRWNIPSFPSQDVKTLAIQVRGKAINVGVTVSSTTTLSTWTGTDTQAGNNSATIGMTVLPSPNLAIAKTVTPGVAVPGTELTYTTTVSNPAHAQAHFVVVEGAIDPNLAFRIDTFGPNSPFQFTGGGSGVSFGTIEYSTNGGTSWGYSPVSGAGGAPAGYDALVTNWRIVMSGVMASHGATFEIRYAARVE